MKKIENKTAPSKINNDIVLSTLLNFLAINPSALVMWTLEVSDRDRGRLYSAAAVSCPYLRFECCHPARRALAASTWLPPLQSLLLRGL
jgi:hypothetical protein